MLNLHWSFLLNIPKRVLEALERRIYFTGGRGSGTVARVRFHFLSIIAQSLQKLNQDCVRQSRWWKPRIEGTVRPGNDKFGCGSALAVVYLMKDPTQLTAFLASADGPCLITIGVLLRGNEQHCRRKNMNNNVPQLWQSSA